MIAAPGGPDMPAAPVSAASDLKLRVASALVLAPLALAATAIGGVAFVGFWLAASLVVLYEWLGLVDKPARSAAFAAGAAMLALAAWLAHAGRMDVASGAIAAAAFAALVVASIARRPHAAWTAAGVLYAGMLLLPPVALRTDPALGVAAILFLFAVVWATDIAAYFTGRRIGGPKLWPAISPKKTWSGAIGGLAAGVAAGIAVALAFDLRDIAWIAALGFVGAVVAEAGDLFESWVKRHFGAKDSGRLIPGHGGLMDRLDALISTGLLFALVGWARGGWDAAASGLLVW